LVFLPIGKGPDGDRAFEQFAPLSRAEGFTTTPLAIGSQHPIDGRRTELSELDRDICLNLDFTLASQDLNHFRDEGFQAPGT